MRASDVLVVGVNGLTGEVIKNTVLAGINSLTILDDKEVRYRYHRLRGQSKVTRYGHIQ